MGLLLDILEPLSAADPSVMLYVGMLSKEHRAYCKQFWVLRHAAFCRGDFVRGQARTRGIAASIAGNKRKRCQGCGERLALPWPFDPTICICNKCTKQGGPARYRLISFTKAFYSYKLTTYELWCIDQFHTSKSNNTAAAPSLIGRTKFRWDDVATLACDKFG